jgi:hypothetical protein
MARKLRVEYRGAIYRVLNRGHRREPIFQTDRDRTLFLDTLAETCRKTGGQDDAQELKPARRLRQEMRMSLRWIPCRLHMGVAGSLVNFLRGGANKAIICDYAGPTRLRFQHGWKVVKFLRHNWNDPPKSLAEQPKNACKVKGSVLHNHISVTLLPLRAQIQRNGAKTPLGICLHPEPCRPPRTHFPNRPGSDAVLRHPGGDLLENRLARRRTRVEAGRRLRQEMTMSRQ